MEWCSDWRVRLLALVVAGGWLAVVLVAWWAAEDVAADWGKDEIEAGRVEAGAELDQLK